MNCPRCESRCSVISEHYDFNDNILIRDSFCSFCKSGITEKFHENGKYSSEWIDFNV